MGKYRLIERMRAWTLGLRETSNIAAEEITIGSDVDEIVIVDDDQGIHDLWQEKLTRAGYRQKLTVHHFTRAAQFLEWLERRGESSHRRQYFFDYDLCDSRWNGLKLARTLPLPTTHVTLITGLADRPEVVDQCRTLGISLLSKKRLSVAKISPGKTDYRGIRKK